MKPKIVFSFAFVFVVVLVLASLGLSNGPALPPADGGGNVNDQQVYPDPAVTMRLVADVPIQAIAEKDIVCYVYEASEGDEMIVDVANSVTDEVGNSVYGGCHPPHWWNLTDKSDYGVLWYSADKATGRVDTYTCEVDIALTNYQGSNVWRCGSAGG